MTEAKHTPGPHEVLGTVSLGRDGEWKFTVIGRVVGDDETQMTAYVNLPCDVPLYIAAPDMLDALEEIVSYVAPTLKSEFRLSQGLAAALQHSRAAIAKATGAP